VPLAAYAQLGYRATNRDRALHMSRAHFAMMVDADVIFLSDFSELLAELRLAPAICGVMAHDSPFTRRPALTPRFSGRVRDDDAPSVYWQLLAERFGLAHLPLENEYSGWGITSRDPEQRFAPAYFNGGMVIGPSDLIEAMCRSYAEAEAAVDDVMDTYFRPQLARTLAIYRAGLAWRTLPLRYNFPNDPRFDEARPAECARISIFHYLRQEVVHRDGDFADRAGVDRLVARSDLAGSNEAVRRRVDELRDAVFAEEMAGV
jgi:hypothetical protein